MFSVGDRVVLTLYEDRIRGTVIRVGDDRYTEIQWDDENFSVTGFYDRQDQMYIILFVYEDFEERIKERLEK